jgi:hypothetical protein
MINIFEFIHLFYFWKLILIFEYFNIYIVFFFKLKNEK